MRLISSFVLLLLAAPAAAQVAPECKSFSGPPPKNYDEGVQQDFLKNYVALATTFSPLHGPIPSEPGHGDIGVDLAVMPPLGCEKRFVLNHTKTEDTNAAPVIPQPRINVALPALGSVIPYVGLGYVPPVPVFGTTNVIVSVELGAGMPVGETLQLGARFHATSQKTVGEIATPFEDGDPAFEDLYLASTIGVDAMGGLDLGPVVPYVSVGLVDVSTFFYIGDDGFAANNFHPYFGPAISAGVSALLVERLRLAGEFYGAPGGYSLPDKDVVSVSSAARYGSLYTGRLRLGVAF